MCKPTALRFSDNGIYPTSTPTLPERVPHSDNGDLIRHAIKCHFEDLGRSCRCLGVHLFYREGTPDYVVPDIMAFLDLPADYPALHYKIWEDGAPALVAAILSKTTWEDDLGVKKDIYHAMGVRECWIFNPIRQIVLTQPALQGYVWCSDGYEAVAPTLGRVDGTQKELFPSDVLGTVWDVVDSLLRLFSPREKAWYASSEGNYAQKKEAERRAIEAEAEIERLQRPLRAQGLASNGQYPANGAG